MQNLLPASNVTFPISGAGTNHNDIGLRVETNFVECSNVHA